MRERTADSDVPVGSEAYEQIADALIASGLNLAFFTFVTSDHSHCARRERKGGCPVLSVYVRYDDDFRATGIDHHRNNWGDDWTHTKTVRATLNAILRRLGYGDRYVSEHTFVFVYALEEFARKRLGRDCKEAVKRVIREHVPNVRLEHLFWNGERYDAIVGDAEERKRAKATTARIADGIARALASADTHRACRRYSVEIAFSVPDRNTYGLWRDDIE